jgi:GT2 family glycosyltransferase
VLSALSHQSRPPERILVVDNASAPETRAMLASEFPAVHVRRL